MGMKFINLPKSKHFKITTRFYDERKEAMKEREERYRREMEQNNGEPVSSYASGIKGSFRAAGRKGSSDRTLAEARRKSNMRLLYILIILLALLYFVMR